MAFDPETLAKLTTSLAGDVELYNAIINQDQQHDTVIAEKDQALQETQGKLQESEKRGQEYLGQISNLLSRIPVGNAEPSKSMEQKLEEIKTRSWTK